MNLPAVFGNPKNINCYYCLAVVLVIGFSTGLYAKDIPIFTNGIEYPSIEAYKASKEAKQTVTAVQEPVVPQDKEQHLTKAINAATAKEWQLIGVGHGVGRIVADFDQNWENPLPKFKVRPKELEQRMESLLDGRKTPVLIVSENNKLRVMELKQEAPR